MSDFFATEDDYANLVSKIGASRAAQMAKEQGWSIRPNELKINPIAAIGGDDGMDQGENKQVADNSPSDDDLASAYASLGPLSAMDLTDPKQISKAIIANAAKQQQYYDNLANEIKQRRYGPSESEKLLALSSAFFSPTSVRGFSGTMGNVLPVLQKFGEIRRTGEQERTEALQNLAKQRMASVQGDIKNALLLQKMQADYLQAGKPKYRLGQDNAFYVEPGTGGYPEMPGMDAYGNYVITDRRQLNYLPVNTRVVEPGQDPTKPNYVPERGKGE